MIGKTETVGEKGFQKREFVITEMDGQYPKDIAIQFTKDKCDLLDKVNVGDSATVSFNIESKEFKGRYYTNLTGWKLDIEGKVAPAPFVYSEQQNNAPVPNTEPSDLPF